MSISEERNLILDFLKSFSVALSNIRIYYDTHPIFLKSLENTYNKLLPLFSYYEPFVMEFSPSSVLVDKEEFSSLNYILELADFFHRRKIKKIIINKWVKKEELGVFLTKLTPKLVDILKLGGIKLILNQGGVKNISIEELDYSQLLSSGKMGDDVDLWGYLLKKSRQDEEQKKFILDNWDKIINIIGKVNNLKNSEFKENFIEFLHVFKEMPVNHRKILLMDIIKILVEEEDILGEVLPRVIKIIGKDSFTREVLENVYIINTQPKTFSYLVKYLDKDILEEYLEQGQVSEGLKTLIKGIDNLPFNLKNYKMVPISDIESFNIEYHVLTLHYLYILLDILDGEQSYSRIDTIIERLRYEKKVILERKELLKVLLEILDKKEQVDICVNFQKEIFRNLEEMILRGDKISEDVFDIFIKSFQRSDLDYHLYIERILEDPSNREAILLFSLSYPLHIDELLIRVKERGKRYIYDLINTLGAIDNQYSYIVLKKIFPSVDNFLKREILYKLANFSYIEAYFVRDVLLTTNFTKEGINLLRKVSIEDKREIIKDFLFFPNPLGIRDRILYERLILLKENSIDIPDSIILELIKRKIFLHSNLRRLVKEWRKIYVKQ